MNFEKFKELVFMIRDRLDPAIHVGFTKRDDGLYSALISGIVITSTFGSEYITVRWGDRHMSRIKALDIKIGRTMIA